MPRDEPLSCYDHKSMADSVLTLDSNLLTPPLLINDVESPPFKPLDSDKVSLSMKKSGHRAKHRRRLNRACASSGDVNEERKGPTQAEQSLSRKSLPDLKKYKRPLATNPVLSGPGNYAWIDRKLQTLFSEQGRGSSSAVSCDSRRRSDLSPRPRRWTLPSKSQPTNRVCFTNHMSTVTFNKPSDGHSTETPAMIVLRRATTKKERAPSIAQTNITFFPPPKFSRTSIPLLSFLRIGSQPSQERISYLNTNASMAHSSAQSLASTPPRRPSVTPDCAQPGCSVTASPAVTDVMVYSAQQQDAADQLNVSGHRRFSTKIVSQSSVHEIIWDENVISGESNSSSSNVSRKLTMDKKRKGSSHPRKASIAVEKLETQLRRDSSDTRTCLPESPSDLRHLHQMAFQSLLNFKFGDANIRTGDLKQLPRSRASLPSAALQTNDLVSNNARRKTQLTGACNDLEFFPTLLCRPSCRSLEQPAILDQSLLSDGTAYHDRRSSMGRRLGQCSHRRRESAVNYYHFMDKITGLARPSNEHMPLLSHTSLDGTAGSQPQHPASSSYTPTSVAGAHPFDPLNKPPMTSLFHVRRRRLCRTWELGNLKLWVAHLERDVRTSKEAISKGKNESKNVLKETVHG